MRIGIDFDNTIARYDDVFANVARARNWVAHDFQGSKRQLRDTVRLLHDGEIKWQLLQAEVYGPRMCEAVPFPGVIEFFDRACRRGFDLFIVSHKTQFANYAEHKVDLREAAIRWMEVQGFFDPAHPGFTRARVFFAASRAEKIARIAELGCTVFIDDLEEVFAEPDFPGHITRVLLVPAHERTANVAVHACESWAEISRHLLGETVESLSEVTAIAARLAGTSVLNIAPVRTGNNNRLFQVSTVNGSQFALKGYSRQASDPRDRLATEFNALEFMRRKGIADVPRAIASDAIAGFALYEWIDGTRPVVDRVAIDAALVFAAQLHVLGADDEAATMPAASEACLSAATIVTQLEARLTILREVAPSYPELEVFLEREYAPTAARVIARTKERYNHANLDFDALLEQRNRCLSPSDFGFHNALTRTDGRIIFLDFEYFGWDDPVKLTSDFILHPGMSLPKHLVLQVREGAIRLFGKGDFAERLQHSLPLYGLRWAMILLNEFRPDRWQRRVLAGVDGDRGRVLSRQIGKSRAMLAYAANDQAIL